MRWRVAVVAALLVGCSGGTAAVRVPRPVATTTTVHPAPVTSTTTTTTSTSTTVAPTDPVSAALANTDSCLVVRDATGTVYSHNDSAALAPASTQKLLVAAAALDILGPSYRFVTNVVASARPVGGRVGDLWLVGGGDPLLATPQYAALLASSPVTASYVMTPVGGLVAALLSAGVRTVSGTVHGDDSRYDTLRYLPTWSAEVNRGEFDVGPLGALEVDQGLDSWHPAVPTADPAAHGAGVLAQLLTASGAAAAPGRDAIAPPGGVVLASVASAPLSAIVTAMLQASDNQIAELLVRELSHHAGGPGSTADGVRMVMRTVGALGVPVDGVSLVDGSGLSITDRVTCPTLLGALDLDGRFPVLASALPVAGVSGGLHDVFLGTPIAGHLAAKGGYITGVGALAGRINAPRPLRFAFIINAPGLNYPTGLAYEKRVILAMFGLWN